MFSGQQIHDFQQQAARRAARERVEPIVLYSGDDAWRDWRSAPFIGLHKPAGWRPVRVDELAGSEFLWRSAWRPDDDGELRFFCDSSGWGNDRELALSIGQQQHVALELQKWAKSARLTVGVALVELSQFQAVLSAFAQRADYWKIRERHDAALARRRARAAELRRKGV